MRKNKLVLLSAMLLMMFFVACGGNKQKVESAPPEKGAPPAAAPAQAGDAGVVPAKPEAAAVAPEKAPSGNGTITVKVFAGKKEGEGLVTVSTAEIEPKVVAENQPAGKPIDLPAGTYDIKTTFTTAVDHPVREFRDVKLNPGDKLEREIQFPVGQVTLTTRSNAKAKVKLRRQAEGRPREDAKEEPWFETMPVTNEPFIISAGTFEIEVQTGTGKGKGFKVKGVTVYSDGIQTIPLPVQ